MSMTTPKTSENDNNVNSNSDNVSANPNMSMNDDNVRDNAKNVAE